MTHDIQILSPEFGHCVMGNAPVEKLFTGTRWSEGPVYFRDTDLLIWSDIPNNRMLRWTPDGNVSVFRQPSNFSNGSTRDREGRLITCEHGTRRVTRTELDGSLTVLADSYKGKRLNSPNDVVVKSDGTVWFTDPPYGIITDYEGFKAPQEQEGCYVYRLDPASGALDVVADDFGKPNGIAFSPDEKTLYVSDTSGSHDPKGNHHIRCFDVVDGKRLAKGRVFAETGEGFFDGFRLDTDGRVWTSAGKGVECYGPSGGLLGRIVIGELVSNVCFGGARRNRLFITALSGLYSVYLAVNGALRP
jgi:gluconolactonase